MTKSLVAGLCAAVALTVGSPAFAAGTSHNAPYHAQPLPPLYVSASLAQASCPTDQVVWVNWTARKSHVAGDRWYASTKTGAYACARPSAEAGIVPGSPS